jgi:AbiV family abortive infection protein
LPAIVIPWRETLEGARLACENARRLANDALALHQASHRPTAYALSLLAWEEANKAGLLLRHYVRQQNLSQGDYDLIFGDHVKKLGAYVEYVDVLYPSAQATGLDPKVVEASKRLNLKKQRLGLYVDYLEVGKNDWRWTSPMNFDRELDRVDPKWREMLRDQIFPATYWATQAILVCAQIQSRIKQIK